MPKMFDRFLIILFSVLFAAQITAENGQRGFIKDIISGPFQRYSGMPLVDLNGTYYHFERAYLASWSGGLEFCRDLGLVSVSVETEEENTLLKNYMLSLPGLYEFWTSGSSLNSSRPDEFWWSSTGDLVSFTDWAAGEGSGDQPCIQFSYLTGYRWKDYFCDLPAYLVCEDVH